MKPPRGSVVELFPVADPGYVFVRFWGDCATSGQLSMTSSRVCGAAFEKARTGLASPSHTLTVDKPAGGTLVSPSGILCGTLGSQCTATLSDGAPVILRAIPDAEYQFVTFTGACTPSGETVMTVGRVCGATFARAAHRAVPPTTTVAPAASISESTAREVIDAYYAAYRARDFEALRAIFPAASDRDRRRIEALSRDFEPCDYNVGKVAVAPVTASQALVMVDVTETCRPRIRAPAPTLNASRTFELVEIADGRWIIVNGP